MRLVGTTKTTLQAIRDRTHWNSSSLAPMDPVTLGLCSQIDLDFEVNRAAKDKPAGAEDRGQTLVSAEVDDAADPSAVHRGGGVRVAPRTSHDDDDEDIDVNSVFAKLKEPVACPEYCLVLEPQTRSGALQASACCDMDR